MKYHIRRSDECALRENILSALHLRRNPSASAVTFIGLIYLLILVLVIVMVAAGARQASGLEDRLTLGSLVLLRLSTSFVDFIAVRSDSHHTSDRLIPPPALLHPPLPRFQLSFYLRFGRAGFLVFWMLTWIDMLACGLALEAMITLFTARFIPFFLVICIISNVSISILPLQVLISRAVRTIIFRTWNDVGMNFGILLAWVALSCATVPLSSDSFGGASSRRAPRYDSRYL
ncbi:hypothetical protein FB451DRAFT_1404254 [Mycena latifolia]|nr:hypothetical protein FB451DRAFT_1404254 [Mycena latifolia]